MVISDETMNNLLALAGIRIGHRKYWVSLLATSFILLYFVSEMYVIVSCFYHMFYFSFKNGFPVFFLSTNSMFIWCSLFLRRKKNSTFIQNLYQYRKRYVIEQKTSKYISIVIILLSLLMFLWPQTQHFHTDTVTQHLLKFWSHGFEIPDRNLRISIIIFINFAYFVAFSFPVFDAFIINVMLYKCAEMLKFYNKLLQFRLSKPNKYRNFELLWDFFNIKKLLSKMIKIMNYTLFFIIIFSLNNIFGLLYYIIQFKFVFNYTVFAGASFCFISSSITLVTLSVCSSFIPENLSEIRLTVRQNINEHVFKLKPPFTKNTLRCLQRIESEEIIYVSVCNMFLLTKSFILTTIGIIFTYCLLFVNAVVSE